MAGAGVSFLDLRDDLPFGARVRGVTHEAVQDAAVCADIRASFEDRGLLLFEDVEQTPEMQLAISRVIGELKDHPVPSVSRANEGLAAGVIDLRSDPEDGQIVLEIEGGLVHNWLPWHFDHAYNDELNRAGVLRPVVIAPSGGTTGFADGVDLYRRLSPELREQIEGRKVIYHLAYLITNLKFGRPPGMRVVRTSEESERVEAEGWTKPRALHPAVWTRQSGEKVLHVGALHAVGLEGLEDVAWADELLEKVCQEVRANPAAYYHAWKPGQMLTWDNWRFLHCVTGTDPKNARRMHRTTVKGDYGLGAFERRPEAVAG
jgi:taurine dioxygenase